MKTKKITLLISILFTFVIFAAPAFAFHTDHPTFWWDIDGDMNPDTTVNLAAGETLNADLYLSGVDPESIFNGVDGHITYANPDQFNELTLDDTHLNFDFELFRQEEIGFAANGDRWIYQSGLLPLGVSDSGDDIAILGEYDVYYPGSGIYWAGLKLTANDTIDPLANIVLNLDGIDGELDMFQPCGDGVWMPRDVMNLTINPVPVPAAVWLLGSGILGLVGINRRKNS
jgi:hypothetical protein